MISSYGDKETRTPNLRRAKAALSQLSYIPTHTKVGLVGLEPTTSPLSEERSNRLSYRPFPQPPTFVVWDFFSFLVNSFNN